MYGMWLVILYETVGLYCSSDKLMMMMMKQMGRLVEERERERWVLLKIPRCDIDGVGEGK